eukprot:TRINITY_DN4773_c0_g2_i1.p2 TRINITY_DN4773_c0_g2~~TRINITY_DN4773_c0_g2_i1.p2  ORF type:complete len:142 (-),score=8.74 TRINITY_DN4773_c0_g2_i1:552-977(-)
MMSLVDFFVFGIVNKFRFNRDYRVKLVAIAKDEAAYLPDWIFHHLRMGFDSIDIYINNTSDNTEVISNKLKELKDVRFIDGDRYFEQTSLAPQILIYQKALRKCRWEGYTHIVFLDIDEFWVSLDLKEELKRRFVRSVVML